MLLMALKTAFYQNFELSEDLKVKEMPREEQCIVVDFKSHPLSSGAKVKKPPH